MSFFHSFHVQYYIELFFYLQTTLHSLVISPLVMVDNPLSVLLNLVYAFIDNFFIIIYERYYSVVFLYCLCLTLSLGQFWPPGMSLKEFPPLQFFWEAFEEDWC